MSHKGAKLGAGPQIKQRKVHPRISQSTYTELQRLNKMQLLQPKHNQLRAYDPTSDNIVEGLDLENLEKIAITENSL